MSIFRRRVGGNPTWQEEDYEREHTGESIQKLKDLGLTLVILHFYKGFGLEAERDHIQKALRLASIIKKHGLRLGVYGVLRLSAEGGPETGEAVHCHSSAENINPCGRAGSGFLQHGSSR